MKEIERLFRCRIEEMPFIAVYLLISLRRDALLFKAYSLVYDEKYIEKFELLKKAVELLVSPKKLTGEMKSITVLVASEYKKIRDIVNQIEDYLKLSDMPLTMGIDDFGIRAVRLEVWLKNDEGVVKELRTLYDNAESNKAALALTGYTAEVSAEFKALIDSLGTQSVAQNTKMDERIMLTQENLKEINSLWAIMVKVMETGKKIALKKEIAGMKKDYTFSKILKKVRLDRKEVDSTGAPAGTK